VLFVFWDNSCRLCCHNKAHSFSQAISAIPQDDFESAYEALDLLQHYIGEEVDAFAYYFSDCGSANQQDFKALNG
jgi:hypothetical protein